MHRIRAITLDLDDTLWAIAPVIERAEHDLWQWLGLNYPRIPLHWNRDTVAGLRDSVFAEHAGRAHDLGFIRRTVLSRMAAVAGYDDALVAPAFAVFDRARNAVLLYPDVIPALEQLRRQYPLVAVTNGNANLETIGIRHLFSEVVTAAAAGAAKPAAPIFEAACAATGMVAAEVLHVGDHPEFDVAGAQQAGMRAAWINRRGAAWPDALAPPDAEITRIDDLPALLDAAAD